MRYIRRTADDENPEPEDEIPVEHHDAIRLAFKCLKTAVTFHREALDHMTRARDVLEPVCDSLDGGDTGDGGDEGGERPTGDGGDERTFAAQRRRAAELRRRFGAL